MPKLVELYDKLISKEMMVRESERSSAFDGGVRILVEVGRIDRNTIRVEFVLYGQADDEVRLCKEFPVRHWVVSTPGGSPNDKEPVAQQNRAEAHATNLAEILGAKAPSRADWDWFWRMYNDREP